eukprot:CAMPEP_0172409144 /NCGR_PEP_ID=MMETSP1061-20121228/76218_1 /TAXON_ID=37318 /ORGANISM="Pseudo-nitzschia pungens, Strain cf. pungens" /LENGTH=231 /DNA_ID=CAMNT_0013145293 /DNA_START=265 /DNA_END=960 /DNA_ORIENTATION=+
MKVLPQLTTIAVVAVSSAAVADAFSSQTTQLSSRPSTGSSSRRSHSSRSHSSRSHSSRSHSSSRLFVQEPTTQEKVEAAPMATATTATTTTPQPDEETSNANPNSSAEPQAQAQPVANETVRSITRATRKGLAFGSSVIFNVIGIYFGFGLLLNLFGYAYSFSLQEGYKIDTIQNRRIELQFQQESKRYEMERASKMSQQRSVAAIEAVGRADETTVTATATATATLTTTE